MAQDEATTKIDKILAPYIKDEFEGRLVAVEVDWNSLEQKNTNVNRILRYKKYLQFPSCVLEPLFQSFKIANLAVLRMLRAKLQKIRVVAKGVNSIVLENGGDLMIVSYDWSAQNFTDKQWKEVIEEEVHLKCQGTSVASISAEIALQTALGYHKLMNQELCNKAGMVAKDGGGEVLVLDFFSFADAPEFIEKYGPLRFKPLYTTCLSALNSLVAGFLAISNTEVGAPIVKSIQRILIKLDVKSVDSTHDAVLHWDSETKTFTVTHSLQSFEHPRAYRYIPRLEDVLGILAESCRYATKAAVELFCSTLRQDFGLSSLPIIFDESYLATQKFNLIHPREQKEIIVNFFTTIPPSIFLGPMGLLHCSEFPKSRQILHDKVKKIRIMPDDQLAAKTSKVELINEELLVRLALDSTEWTAPIGYQLSQIIGSRPMIESEVIAEVDMELASYTQKLRSVSKNPKITAKFNWTDLLKDQLFQASEKYVSDVRSLFSQVKMAFEGSGAETAIYDGGLFHFLEFEDLAAHMGNLETLEFHTSTKNSIISVGEFGLFTPYYYRVIREGNALHIYFNSSPYPVGVGSMVEWVLNPDQAKKREAVWVTSLSERNFQEEMARRDTQVKNTIAANEAAVKKYELGVAEFNRQNAINANSPNTERCNTCWGEGGWHCGSSYTTCYRCHGRGWVDAHKIIPVLPAVPQPRPIPTFPTVTVADFTRGLNRRELRQHHFIEAKLD